MWTKSIWISSLPPIQILLILQISFGKPTTESRPLSFNSSTNASSSSLDEPLLLDLVDGNISSTSLGAPLNSESETLSVSLTVLSENETLLLDESSSYSSSSFMLGNISNDDTSFAINSTSFSSSTSEPEYYDDHNSTSSSPSESDDLELDMLDTSTFSSSSESPLMAALLVTDEMEVAGSLDKSVTAAMDEVVSEDDNHQQFSRSINTFANSSINTMKVNGSSNTSSSFNNSTTINGTIINNRSNFSHEDADDDGRNKDVQDDRSNSTQSGSVAGDEDVLDDSIIIASLSSNLNLDTLEPPNDIISSSNSGGVDDGASASTREMMLNTDEMQTEVIISSSSEPSFSYSASLVDNPVVDVVSATAAA